MLGNSGVVEQQAASQEGLSPKKLVIPYFICHFERTTYVTVAILPTVLGWYYT
jgi:hypothetical protein